MKIKTYFYRDKPYWTFLNKEASNDESLSYRLIYKSDGSMISICGGTMIVVCRDSYNDSTAISIQVGSWTLAYQIQ